MKIKDIYTYIINIIEYTFNHTESLNEIKSKASNLRSSSDGKIGRVVTRYDLAPTAFKALFNKNDDKIQKILNKLQIIYHLVIKRIILKDPLPGQVDSIITPSNDYCLFKKKKKEKNVDSSRVDKEDNK